MPEKTTQPAAFAGIPRDCPAFLAELRDNNTAAWFEAAKERYRAQVLSPMTALVAALAPGMLALDPLFVTAPAVDKTISRIRRDVRFSRDKSPYRASVWLTFKRPALDWKDRPCFFFEITPEGRRHGMGFYAASRPTMDAFRRAVLEAPDAFAALAAKLADAGVFTLEGERYKRPPVKNRPEALAPWLDCRSFYLTCQRPLDDRLFSPDLAAGILEDFRTAAPLYRFIQTALDAADVAAKS